MHVSNGRESRHVWHSDSAGSKKKKKINVYLFLRNREQAGEGQRESETQNPKQAPGSDLSAQSLTQGSNA